VIDDLLHTAKHLTAILARENALLRAMDLAQATAMLEQKGQATTAFTAANAAAAASGLTAAQRRRAVEEVGQRLHQLAGDNRQLLERAIRVQRRIIGLIAEAAPPDPTAARYDAGGGLTGARKRAAVALSTRA
jgi:hypothetical protein